MKALLLATSLLGVLTAAAYEDPFLPEWIGKERERLEDAGWIAGGILLSDEPLPEDGALELEGPTADELVGDSQLPPEIPEKFLSAYFAERPKAFLIDPQGLLSPQDFRDRLKFLNDHSNDTAVDLYVYLIGGKQDIPGQVREEELIERFFSEGRPAAIVFYYFGVPQRSEVYLSPSVTDAVPPAEQQRALASSVMQAFEKLDPAEQLEAFLVQMSIRVYWMERMLGGKPSEQPFAAATIVKKSAKELPRSASMVLVQAKFTKYRLPAGIGLAAMAMGALVHYARQRHQKTYFPVLEVEPRLGGTHAAGIGAVISFASVTLPPAAQRDQVPEYLRRA